MHFKSISINNFRNISSATLSTDAEDIILTGINGQGKTNLLEGIYTLCYGSSFRTSNFKDCIQHESEGFSIKGLFVNDSGENETIQVVYKDGKRKITLDGKEIKDRKELIYQFPCIVFCHEDINFIKGEPEDRRRFFDQMMSLYSPLFFDSQRNYRSILAQRNAAIKNQQYGLVSLYNERLAFYGLEIMKARTEAVYMFNQIFPDLFSLVSNTDLVLEIDYQPSWKDLSNINEIATYLDDTFERDVKMNTTTSGIHRDKFVIKSQYGSFSSIGSTGQLRLCSLIFRIAQARYFTLNSGKKPILLIDDVLLELDSDKRALVLNELKQYSQAFYTFLPNESYFSDTHKHGLHYLVEGGNFIDKNS